MKIKTEVLNNLVNLAYKGAGNNKLIPITQMIGIKVNGSQLVLCATDSFNYLYVTQEVEDNQEEIDVCVNADILSKLVSKFTCEFTTLEMNNNYLAVTGNGNYKLDLLLDDEGNIYKFPVKSCPKNINPYKLKTSKFIKLKTYAEKSLAQTMEEPDLIAYYVNKETSISTDRNIMTVINEEFTETPLTLRSKFVDLVVEMKESVDLYTWVNDKTNEHNLFITDGTINIFSKVNGNINDYPYEAIKNLTETAEFGFNANINVKEFLDVLDRISLFVTQYDSNVINLELKEGKLYVSSIKSNGVEVVNLENPSNNIDWKGAIDIEFLKSQLASFTKEKISIYLGNDNCIKLTEDNVVKLICLVEQ